MAVDILVFMIGTGMIFILGILGASRMPLLALFGLIFGMIFTAAVTGAVINNQIVVLGTPLAGSSGLLYIPILATLADLVILIARLR